jgi:hypothetical protein
MVCFEKKQYWEKIPSTIVKKRKLKVNELKRAIKRSKDTHDIECVFSRISLIDLWLSELDASVNRKKIHTSIIYRNLHFLFKKYF